MHVRPGHLWSAWATHAAIPHLPVPALCRRTAYFSDRTALVCPSWLTLWPKGEALAVRNTRHQVNDKV
jgi:hypothetical protein